MRKRAQSGFFRSACNFLTKEKGSDNIKITIRRCDTFVRTRIIQEERKRAKPDDRFVTIHKEDNSFSNEGLRYVLVDKKTGVTYLFIRSGYGAGITPLLDRDGKPVITRIDN